MADPIDTEAEQSEEELDRRARELAQRPSPPPWRDTLDLIVRAER